MTDSSTVAASNPFGARGRSVVVCAMRDDAGNLQVFVDPCCLDSGVGRLTLMDNYSGNRPTVQTTWAVRKVGDDMGSDKLLLELQGEHGDLFDSSGAVDEYYRMGKYFVEHGRLLCGVEYGPGADVLSVTLLLDDADGDQFLGSAVEPGRWRATEQLAVMDDYGRSNWLLGECVGVVRDGGDGITLVGLGEDDEAVLAMAAAHGYERERVTCIDILNPIKDAIDDEHNTAAQTPDDSADEDGQADTVVGYPSIERC